MKIIFEDLPSVHSNLSSVVCAPSKKGSESAVLRTPGWGGKSVWVEFGDVRFNRPLNRGWLEVHRKEKTYYAEFVILANKEEVFNGLSKQLGKKLSKKLGNYWSRTDYNGCGYVLDEHNLNSPEEAPLMSIIDTEYAHSRIICLGSHGARIQSLDTSGDFCNNLKKLEEVVNTFLDACFTNLLKTKQIKTIPDYTLFMST